MKNFVYGKNVINVLITSKPNLIKKLYLSDSDKLLTEEFLREKKFDLEILERWQFDELLPGVMHQMVAAEIKFWPSFQFKEILKNINTNEKNQVILILDRIQSPYNFGALVRTATACNVLAVIATKNNQTKLNATVATASAGTVFAMKFVFVSNLNEVIKKLKKKNFWIYSASQNGKNNYFETDFTKTNIALIVGNENNGLKKTIVQNSDFVLKIPMIFNDSLNVSVAGSLILYAIRNKQNFWKKS